MGRSMALPLILLGAGAITCIAAGFSLWRRYQRSAETPHPVAVIVGSSLAETLHGPTVAGTCDACRHPLRFAVESLPRVGDVLCPNCGEPIDSEGLDLRQADRIAVRPRSPDETPEAGRLYVFSAPDDEAAEPIVKRVVAVPGQRVSIAGGDLFLDGERLRKDPRDEAFPRVVVHDGDSLWSQEPAPKDSTTYAFRPKTIWSIEPKPTPVLDAYPSQATERRRLNFVPDVWASGRLVSRAPSAVEFRYRTGDRAYTLAISADGTWILDAGDLAQPIRQGKLSDLSHQERFRFGLLDRQIFLVRAGRQSVVIRLEDDQEFAPSDSSIAISIPAGAELTDLRVERDVHYLPPIPGENPWTEPEGSATSGWFALGDYPAYSVDSRHFGRLSGETLLGEALLPPIDDRPTK